MTKTIKKIIDDFVTINDFGERETIFTTQEFSEAPYLDGPKYIPGPKERILSNGSKVLKINDDLFEKLGGGYLRREINLFEDEA